MPKLDKEMGLQVSNKTILTWSAPLLFSIKNIYLLLLSLAILAYVDFYFFFLNSRENYIHTKSRIH